MALCILFLYIFDPLQGDTETILPIVTHSHKWVEILNTITQPPSVPLHNNCLFYKMTSLLILFKGEGLMDDISEDGTFQNIRLEAFKYLPN